MSQMGNVKRDNSFEGKVLTIENVQNYYDVRIHLLKNRIREAIQKNKEYQKGKVPKRWEGVNLKT